MDAFLFGVYSRKAPIFRNKQEKNTQKQGVYERNVGLPGAA